MRRSRRARSDRPAGLPAWARPSEVERADLDGLVVEVRTVQPYRAVKSYLCPGCRAEIVAGVGHLVVVPVDAPADRRHWHRSCWQRRDRRRPR